MIATSYYAGGARETIWAAFSYVLGPLIVAVLSIRFGEGGWTNLDKFCLVAAAVSIFIWFMTGSPGIALASNLLIDALGVVPTLKKSWLNPETENRTGWTIGSMGAFVNLFAVDAWANPEIFVYPVYMMVNTGLIAGFVWFSPFRKPTDFSRRHTNFGEHLTLDGYGGHPALLDDKDRILDCLYDLVDDLGMQMLANPRIYRATDNQIKDPGGWSSFVVIAESHISIHTFPARQFVSADVYTCKSGLPKDRIRKCIQQAFQLQEVEVNFLIRGKRYPVHNVVPDYVG